MFSIKENLHNLIITIKGTCCRKLAVTSNIFECRKLCGGDDDEKISQSWNRCVLPSIISTTLIIINDCLNFKYSMWLKSPQFVAKMSFMNYLYSKTHPSSFVCH
ncbi:hypothetical protein RclHR1_03220020 [Rhizophagus clarus]|uniref:Uncharacterized protein n=1 Tax=Rhizophagus clarus TaxID=94130 RepID=A0A2Z6R802_9GLOM|nr:hypothetical protein RclHR1_03220020 [Rhizophagus clarus]